MELRPPPSTASSMPPRDGVTRWLLVVNLLAVLALAGLVWTRAGGGGAATSNPEHAREIASKLKAAGALDEAATLYGSYLAATDADAETRANVAYSVGSTYLDDGQYEKALRWFYEAESLGVGSLEEELAKKVVHALERLGRFHSAKAALDARVRLDDPSGDVKRSASDAVVARIGPREIHRSEVLRLLDDLPPEMARQFAGPQQRAELLKKYVADELIWRKAQKLEFDEDPEVRRQHAELLKQLAISKFVEEEVVGKIQVDPRDVKNFFEANRSRYEKEGEPLDQMPPQAERDYRMSKIQAAYQEIVDQELSTESVELFAERMSDG